MEIIQIITYWLSGWRFPGLQPIKQKTQRETNFYTFPDFIEFFIAYQGIYVLIGISLELLFKRDFPKNLPLRVARLIYPLTRICEGALRTVRHLPQHDRHRRTTMILK
jgi:hypothetical protein